MLKHPHSDIEFAVSPRYFIGDFDVYDREEALGGELAAFDPNVEDQLRDAMCKFFFGGARVALLTTEHKHELLRVTHVALGDPDYDFEALITDECGEGHFALPAEWEIKDARKFFSQIYGLAKELWT